MSYVLVFLLLIVICQLVNLRGILINWHLNNTALAHGVSNNLNYFHSDYLVPISALLEKTLASYSKTHESYYSSHESIKECLLEITDKIEIIKKIIIDFENKNKERKEKKEVKPICAKLLGGL